MRNVRPLTALLVVGMAFALAACGGGDKKSSSQNNADIEDQLGFDQAGILARQSRVENGIRDCMKSEGFDYVPVDPVAQRAALFGSSRLSDLDFAKQFGYGISTLWGHVSATADPNQRMRLSLSPADRRAYDRALGGDNPGGTFAAAVDTGDFTKLGGCTLKATERVFGGAQVLSRLSGKLDQLEERIFQDQRMVRAVEKWASCMSGAGYQYEEPEAIDSDLFKRTERIVGELPGQFATGPAPGVKPPPYDHAALAALQRQEVAIAVADYNCEHKYITPVEEVVRVHYQNLFRQQNQSLIAQVKPVR
ncbi:MAG TPA: hypothetical protein VGJ70_10170 [Solirubrobacteraceae bacterium]